MANIGIVLAGAASKGAYEIGCLRAIEERFGKQNIKYVCSASVGALIGQAYGMGKMEDLTAKWKSLDVKKHGRFFLSYSGNGDILEMIDDLLSEESSLPFEHHVSIWNFTKSKVEYIPFHELPASRVKEYMKGAIAIPFFSKGEVVDGDRILDGAFLDNIPVYPLLDKDVDYIFCIYFDNCKYFFEDESFNRKMIKMYDFPNEQMLGLMTYKPERFDDMMQYGYDYMNRTIDEIFASDEPEAIYEAIKAWDSQKATTYKPRLTADLVLNNINVMTKRYAKRESRRKKEKFSFK